MKYIVLVVGLLVGVGCGKSLTEEEKKYVGSYEAKLEEDGLKFTLLENRKIEGAWKKHFRWKIVGKEIHIGGKNQPRGTYLLVFKIEPNGDLTCFEIRITVDGEMGRTPIAFPTTYKRIK